MSSNRHKLQKIQASHKHFDQEHGLHYILLNTSSKNDLEPYANEYSAIADHYDFDEDIEFDPHPTMPWLLIRCTEETYEDMLTQVRGLLDTTLEDESNTKKRKMSNSSHKTKKVKPADMPSLQPNLMHTTHTQFNPLIENKNLLPSAPPLITPLYSDWYNYETSMGNLAPQPEDWYRSLQYLTFYNNSTDRSQLPPPKYGLPPTYAYPPLPGYFGMPMMPMPLSTAPMPIFTYASSSSSSSSSLAPTTASSSSSSSSSSSTSAIKQSNANAFLRIGGFFAGQNQPTTKSPVAPENTLATDQNAAAILSSVKTPS